MSARRRLSGTGVALIAAAALVAGAAAFDVGLHVPDPPPARMVAQEPAGAGAWYCPGATLHAGHAILSLTAVGDDASSVTVVHHREDGPAAEEPFALQVGEQAEVVVEGPDAAAGLSVLWRGGPVIATWRVQGVPTAWTACHSAPSSTWLVTGFDTAGSARSKLRLFNPFAEDAVATVSYGTEEGLELLVITESVSVPAHSVVVVDLNEVQPERSHLAALVRVKAGRVIAQGERSPEPIPEGGIAEGLALLTAAPGSALDWSFAFSSVSDGAVSWLSVFNPNERDAEIEVQVSDPLPGGSLLLDELSVPAGAVVRLDLDEVSAAPEFGLSLHVLNDAGVVVTRFTAAADAAPSASLGISGLSRAWALTGSGSGAVSLYNPGGEAIEVEVLTDGAPAAWRAISLAPNQRVVLDLVDAAGGGGGGVLVTASAPVAAELHSGAGEASAATWILEAVPQVSWTGPELRASVRRDPSLAIQRRVWDRDLEQRQQSPESPPELDAPELDAPELDAPELDAADASPSRRSRAG